MENEYIYNKWTEFINDNKYKIFFEDFITVWLNKLEELKKYIDKNNKRPSSESNDNETKVLGIWILNNKNNLKNKKNNMTYDIIYNKWIEFINDNKYKKYFLDNETEWINKLVLLKKYIDENNKTPSRTDKNEDIKILSAWFIRQRMNYKNKNQIISNEEIYNKWTEFINDDKYKKYF
jgi:hypothetical protein